MKALRLAKEELNALRSQWVVLEAQWAELLARRVKLLREIRGAIKTVESLYREDHKQDEQKRKRAKIRARETSKRNRLKRVLEWEAKGYHIWKIAAKLDVTTVQAAKLVKRAKELFSGSKSSEG